MSKKLIFSFVFLFIFLFTGCNLQKNDPLNSRYERAPVSFLSDHKFNDIDKAIIEIANQLLLNISRNHQINYKFAVTSLVNLDDFESTSSFGRMVSESLINELHERRFKVIDFRTRDVMTINKNGEFVLTRDSDLLKDEMPYTLTLVGTYSILDDNRLVLNTRIIDMFTSEVFSTSRIIYEYKDCSKYDLCSSGSLKKQRIPNKIKMMEEK
jgi:TolB-like protein